MTVMKMKTTATLQLMPNLVVGLCRTIRLACDDVPDRLPQSVFEFEAIAIDGTAQSLSLFRGRVLLIVNVASQCGFTPQYQALEALYRRHRARGLEVLGFPCNQFGGQEPGTADEISAFCRESYDVTFPLFATIEVNGTGAHPLYRFLKARRKGLLGSEAIKWNFTKFLVGRDGQPVARFGSRITPAAIEPAILKALEA
jgi:glutathione peroxidase